MSRSNAIAWLGPALTCASGRAQVPRGPALERLTARLEAGEDFTSTLSGARLHAAGDEVVVGREAGRAGIPAVSVLRGGLVWDGRFEIETDSPGEVVSLSGRLAQLPPAQRQALRDTPVWQRPTLPALLTPSGLRTVRKRCLVHDRLLAACGAFAREADLPSRDRGATRAEALSVSGI
jgi:tRNA(Ile)-lysidine synthase